VLIRTMSVNVHRLPGDRADLSRERPYRTLSRHYLWQSRWYNVRQDRLRTWDGKELTYTVIEKPEAVWIVPVTAEGRLILIDQYRYAIDGWCLEVPAGNMEPGTDLLAMAARELREEIGGTAERILPVADFYTMNGIGDEVARVFLALGVTLGEPEREETEYIALREVPVEEALRMARTGEIKDGPSALAILLCEAALRQHLTEKKA
jgi:ADP-ribose pyrophosphatase